MDWLTPEVIGMLAKGLGLTVALTIITGAFAFVLAVLVTGSRISARRRLRWTASAFVEAFRNVPALIQIIFWAFAFPNLLPIDLRRQVFFDNALMDGLRTLTGLSVPYYVLAAGLGLTLNTAAHLAEVLRSGVEAVPTQLVDGARTLGAGSRRVYRSVLLPSVIRTSFPAVSTRLIHNMKNTSLASFVAVPELFHEIQASITRTFRATEFLLLAAVMYLLLSWVMTVLLNVIDGRLHTGARVSR